MPTESPAPGTEHWSRNLFFVLACVGAAVGLGSIWRFPYMAYRNGGGAFLLPYIIALVFIGFPLCLLEIAIGRWCGGSVVAAYKKNRPSFTWIGWWTLINSVLIVFYYCVVLAWCVQYFVYSYNTAWNDDPTKFFTQSVLHMSSGPLDFGGINWATFISLAVVWAFILVIVRGGLRWISTALLITVPLPFIILIVMAVKGVSLPGASDGVDYFIQPRFSDIWRPSVWASAVSQTVLALGLAMGQMVAYASRKRDNKGLTQSAVWICASVLVISILAGLVIFSMMGFLAKNNGVSLQELKLESIFLAFVSYPMAINTLPLAPLWGMMFFGLLIAIGLDSAFAAIEATLPGTMEMTSGGSRKRLGSALCLLGFFGGVLFSTHAGLYWLDIVDHWVEKYAIPSIIIIECVLFAWFAPIEEISKPLQESWKSFPIKSWTFFIRFVIPILLVLVFGGRVFEEGLTAYQAYPTSVLFIAGWGVFAAVILISLIVAVYYNKKTKHEHT